MVIVILIPRKKRKTHCFEWLSCAPDTLHPTWPRYYPSSGPRCELYAGGLGSHWLDPGPVVEKPDRLQREKNIYIINELY